SGETITILRWFQSEDYQITQIIGDEPFDLAQIQAEANANLVQTGLLPNGVSPVGLSGEQIYSTQGLSCHGSQSVGPSRISGEIAQRPLTELGDYIAQKMPFRKPGNCT